MTTQAQNPPGRAEALKLFGVYDTYSDGPIMSRTYWGCRVGRQHASSVQMPGAEETLRRAYSLFSSWSHTDQPNCWNELDSVVAKVKLAIAWAPHSIDVAFDVDGAGGTSVFSELLRSTRWLSFSYGVFLRLSEARTALHQLGVLRTPIQGGGCALELTDRPDSTDPRDAITVLIMEPRRELDARYPYVAARPAKLHDMRTHTSVPFFAGPLYSGYPAPYFVDDEQLPEMMAAIRYVVERTVDPEYYKI